MKNFRHSGDSVELTAPAGGVLSGQGYVIGNRFVVATFSADAGQPFVGACQGVYRLAKDPAMATTDQQRAFWNDTTKLVKNASASGLFMIGTCEGARLAADTYQDVMLDGIAVVVI